MTEPTNELVLESLDHILKAYRDMTDIQRSKAHEVLMSEDEVVTRIEKIAVDISNPEILTVLMEFLDKRRKIEVKYAEMMELVCMTLES